MLLVKALRRLWPGIVFSPLSATRCVELADPPLPGPRWVRVRNRLAGICGSDLHLLRVDADPRMSAAALPATERVYLGHEVVGEVTEIGPGVTRWRVGDRVIMDSEGPNCLNQEIDPPCRLCREGNPLLCENGSVGKGPLAVGGGWGSGFTAHERDLYGVPDGLSDDAAMMIEPLSVGVRTALRRLPRSGERALVVGSGTIGLAVIGALRALSPQCDISAVARYPQQVEMARGLGADRVLTNEDLYEATARITGAKLYNGMLGNRALMGGYSVVYDCVGSGRTVTGSLRWVRAQGTVVLAGASMAPVQADLTPIWHQEVDLVGLYAHGMEDWRGVQCPTYDIASELLLGGRLPVEGFITHRFPMEQWREAARTAMDKRSGVIKVALEQ
jgi:threonine dehydrogenase-like Zn-dependent dehydrogenase